MSHSPPSATARDVPEIGPSLGHLTDAPSSVRRGALGVVLDDLRLDLVTALFDLAGAARQFAAAGNYAGALHSLGRVAWMRAWEHAHRAAAERITAAANAGLEAAAKESRFPARRAARLTLTEADTRAITARLGRGADDFLIAIDTLDRTVAAASAGNRPSDRAWSAWHDALRDAARKLEFAWLALEAAADAEQRRWYDTIGRVRAWRRPMWPFWIGTAATLALAAYAGLVLGGYVPVPDPLRGIVETVWARGWM